MKKSDILFFLFVIALFLPFFISDTIYEWYKSFNAIHGMVMSFVKFYNPQIEMFARFKMKSSFHKTKRII